MIPLEIRLIPLVAVAFVLAFPVLAETAKQPLPPPVEKAVLKPVEATPAPPTVSIPERVHLDLTGDEAASIVLAISRSDLAARIAVPLINDVSSQIQAQAEAAAKAPEKKP